MYAFISYSSKDGEIAGAICRQLEDRGLRCWLAPRDIPPGANYAEALMDAIGDAAAVVLLLSDHSNISRHVQAEVERAFSKLKPVFPVRIRDVAPSKGLELFVAGSQWIDALTPPFDSKMDELAAAIRGLATDSRALRHQPRPESLRRIVLPVVVATLPVGDLPHDPTGRAVLHPRGTTLYLAAGHRGHPSTLIDVDLRTRAVVSRTDLGGEISGLGLSEDGSVLYAVLRRDPSAATVANQALPSDIVQLDPATHKVSNRFAVDDRAFGLANRGLGTLSHVLNLGSLLYVVRWGMSAWLYVFDASSREMVSRIALGAYPTAIIPSPDGSRVYVSAEQSVHAVDTARNAESGVYKCYGRIGRLATEETGRFIYASHHEDGMTVIDTVADSTAELDKLHSSGVAVSSKGRLLYSTDDIKDTVNVIEASTGSLLASVRVGKAPKAPIHSHHTSELLAINTDEGTISILQTNEDD